MTPEYFVNEIYKTQKGLISEFLKKEPEQKFYSYNELLTKIDNTVKELKKPGGGYIPPLSEEGRMQMLKEVKILRKYVYYKEKSLEKNLQTNN